MVHDLLVEMATPAGRDTHARYFMDDPQTVTIKHFFPVLNLVQERLPAVKCQAYVLVLCDPSLECQILPFCFD